MPSHLLTSLGGFQGLITGRCLGGGAALPLPGCLSFLHCTAHPQGEEVEGGGGKSLHPLHSLGGLCLHSGVCTSLKANESNRGRAHTPPHTSALTGRCTALPASVPHGGWEAGIRETHHLLTTRRYERNLLATHRCNTSFLLHSSDASSLPHHFPLPLCWEDQGTLLHTLHSPCLHLPSCLPLCCLTGRTGLCCTACHHTPLPGEGGCSHSALTLCHPAPHWR